MVMTDGRPCPPPVPACRCHPASARLRPSQGLLQLSCRPSSIAPWWRRTPIIPCHIPPHLSPSWPAKYTLVLVSRRPSPLHSALTQPPLSHALTYFAPSFSSSLSTSCFLFFLRLLCCNFHLALLFNSRRYFGRAHAAL